MPGAYKSVVGTGRWDTLPRPAVNATTCVVAEWEIQQRNYLVPSFSGEAMTAV